MQVNNSIHYSSDAYLISKKQHDVDHKVESQAEEISTGISAQNLEEKLQAKSINALQPLQVVTSREKTSETSQESPNSAKQALSSYNNVENMASSQEQFNSVKEMV